MLIHALWHSGKNLEIMELKKETENKLCYHLVCSYDKVLCTSQNKQMTPRHKDMDESQKYNFR